MAGEDVEDDTRSMEGDHSLEVTLAFELSALQAVADPAAVVADARWWADNVGIVSDEPTHTVKHFLRTHEIQIVFHSGPRSERESLPKLYHQPEFDADRYVLVGVGETNREAAESIGWEYFTVEEAAAESEWELAADDEAEAVEEDDQHDGWP